MKSIMELFKGDAVKFFGINKRIISAARTEFLHIQIQKNIDDWVLEADDGSYVHFEFQSTYNKDDLARFMVSDAMLYFKERKPIRTLVVYSSEIENTETALNAGSIRYGVEAFYMVRLDGDKEYERLRAKVEKREPLTKQDLMSVVFLPMMKNSADKDTRFQQAIEISKTLSDKDEQLQIQAMIELLAEKFIIDPERLRKLKELMNMGAITEMIRTDERLEIARNALKEGSTIEFIQKITGLDESAIRDLQAEIENKNNI
jgi:hypothetical protein